MVNRSAVQVVGSCYVEEFTLSLSMPFRSDEATDKHGAVLYIICSIIPEDIALTSLP
jgi:hypothetical protein